MPEVLRITLPLFGEGLEQRCLVSELSNEGLGQFRAAAVIIGVVLLPSRLYRATLELVDLSRKKEIKLKPEEVISLLLQTWNMMSLRFRKDHFSEEHFRELEKLLTTHEETIEALRNRSINDLQDEDENMIESIFCDFERLLGPVGAAKCLHLLAPKFFALWDFKIVNKVTALISKR